MEDDLDYLAGYQAEVVQVSMDEESESSPGKDDSVINYVPDNHTDGPDPVGEVCEYGLLLVHKFAQLV